MNDSIAVEFYNEQRDRKDEEIAALRRELEEARDTVDRLEYFIQCLDE